ncbi:hypothetical protein SAMN05216388_100310 [Halorientalis persicus]|uniref:Uncharacterized protein n=1 Tax=Halorientalis persicus TaxID=1367881 RepID=A0A1H8G6G0_9EURY|nr:hypothetical protein [Halorientalis persicus]SEN39583.1 hypothetical protein SAMN05216388_100310 [Halorientalis persicus]
MNHDRIHAREPTHDRWATGGRRDRRERRRKSERASGPRAGRITALDERDGHCVVTVDDDGTDIDLLVTVAVRDLFVSRLDISPGASPVGERVWYRKKSDL